jgi:LacI family transcriptional regulator
MANIRDVASRAGVSVATVSHVINESRFVAEDTKARVLAAIADLDYRRDGIARSLRRSHTGTIGAIISDITNPFFADLVKGIDHVVHSLPNRVNVMLCNTEEDPDKERAYLDVLMEKRVDGLIVAPAGDNGPYFKSLVEQAFPLVFVDRSLAGINADSVEVDNCGASDRAIRHLIDQGHRRIAVLKATLQANSIDNRLTGYEQAMADAGLEVLSELVVECASDVISAQAGGSKLLDLDPLPDAVFCTNNFMTLGMVRAIDARSLSCPEDIAIVGFDDFAWADAFRPRITAVAQPSIEMGEEAARLLMSRIDKTQIGPPVHKLLDTRLIVRESSRPRKSS